MNGMIHDLIVTLSLGIGTVCMGLGLNLDPVLYGPLAAFVAVTYMFTSLLRTELRDIKFTLKDILHVLRNK